MNQQWNNLIMNHSTLKQTACALALGLLTLSSTFTLAKQAQDIEVKQPFTREMPPGSPATASFMILLNHSNQPIKLVKASSPAAQKVELHTHTNDDGVMRMRKVPFFEIPAHGQTHLKPGGHHIMLISPLQPVQAGNTVSITLNFEDGSTQTVTMPVKSVMNMGNHHDHSHHQH